MAFFQCSDRLACHVSDVERAAVVPLDETRGDVFGIEFTTLDETPGDTQRQISQRRFRKTTPNENSPPPVTLELGDDTVGVLSACLTNRWKDTVALFPARSSDRISEQGIRNMLH